MKKQFTLTLFCHFLMGITTCYAVQDTLTLGGLYKLALHPFKPAHVARWVSSKGFDFNRFAPASVPVFSEHYDVGFGTSGEVVQLVARNLNSDDIRYKLTVQYFSKYRIIHCQTERFKGHFGLVPFVIVCFSGDTVKTNNFLLSMYPVFGPDRFIVGQTVDRLDNASFSMISSLMVLDEKLLPKILFRMYDSKVVSRSEFVYDKEGEGHINEWTSFFVSEPVKIRNESSISELYKMIGLGDLTLRSCEPQSVKLGSTPYWLFGWSVRN